MLLSTDFFFKSSQCKSCAFGIWRVGMGRIAPSLGKLLCCLFKFNEITCQSWKTVFLRIRWSVPIIGPVRKPSEAGSWAGRQESLAEDQDNNIFRHLIFLSALQASRLPPQIHKLPASVSHSDVIVMLQEVTSCNFTSLSLSVIKLCFANIGSGGCHTASLLGEAAVHEEKFFTGCNFTLCHKCLTVFFFLLPPRCCRLGTLQAYSTDCATKALDFDF